MVDNATIYITAEMSAQYGSNSLTSINSGPDFQTSGVFSDGVTGAVLLLSRCLFWVSCVQCLRGLVWRGDGLSLLSWEGVGSSGMVMVRALNHTGEQFSVSETHDHLLPHTHSRTVNLNSERPVTNRLMRFTRIKWQLFPCCITRHSRNTETEGTTLWVHFNAGFTVIQQAVTKSCNCLWINRGCTKWHCPPGHIRPATTTLLHH